MDAREVRELEARKRASTGQLLLRAARLMNEEAVARIREAGLSQLRVGHMAVFPHLDMTGNRLTELARRMGITKQGVGQIVSDLVEMGVVERRRDPSDGRARLVCFTPQGERALHQGLLVLEQLEAELAGQIGVPAMDRLRSALGRLLGALEATAEDRGGS